MTLPVFAYHVMGELELTRVKVVKIDWLWLLGEGLLRFAFLWEFLANFFIYDIIFIYIVKKEGALRGTDGKRKF